MTFCSQPMDNLERKTETCGFIVDHTEVPQYEKHGDVMQEDVNNVHRHLCPRNRARIPF